MEAYSFSLDGRKVTLIDTPGFDDSETSDADILKLIANHMHATYQSGRLLNGLIYLHPVNLNKATGTEMMRTRLFKKILGEEAYSRVVIATTMWDNLLNTETAAQHCNERIKRNKVWGDMVRGGAIVARHDNNKDSALDLIRKTFAFAPVELQLQRELREFGGKLGRTSAGKQLDSDLGEAVSRLKREIEELKKDRDASKAELRAAQRRLEDVESQKTTVGETIVSGNPLTPIRSNVWEINSC